MLTAKKVLAASRVYTEETVIGMGAIKGANCTIKSITKVGDLNTVIFSWTDTEGTEHESTMLVYDGANGTDGQDGAPGADGFSPTITVKTATSSEYVLTITNKNGSYDTPNLKGGGGGGGASSLSDLDDIALSALANGDALIYDSTSGKWKNVQLDIPSELSDLSDVDLASLANADVLKYDFATQKFVNDKIDYSELTGTPTLGTAAAKDSTNAVTENSTDLVESGAVYTGLAAKANTADLGTAAAKDSTNAVTQSSTDLVESGAVYTALADKVDKEAGKGLSTNDFTDAEKSKLDNLELDDLSDVDMTGITDGQILAWDDASSKMVPADQTGTEYTAGMGVDISAGNEISTEFIMYPGTKAEWDLLPTAEKIKYTHTAWEDSQSGIIDNVPTENSDHLVTSGGVFTALSAKANTSDLATVATSGDYDDLTDKPTLGTAAAKDSTNAVTQSSTDLVESGAVYTALGDKADKVTSATNGDFASLDASGNLTDSGKKASDFATAQGLADEAATRSAMGAKNMLPFDLATIKANNTTGTWNNNVYTLNGVDFTFNADGSVLVDGTATGGNAEVDYLLNLSISGDFILSDAVAGVASNYWAFAKVDGDSSNLLILTSDEIPASISSTMDYFRIKVFSGKTASNILFKPMLRLATDSDSTYQPYAMTNQQITPYVQAISNPNLLDNPWFTVNQRGFTDTLPSNGYCVDRFVARGTMGVSLSNGVITLVNNRSDGASWFGQKIEQQTAYGLVGKPMTLSFMLSNGDIKSWSFVLTDTSSAKQSDDFNINGNVVYLRVEWVNSVLNVLLWLRNTNDTISIKAMKLELGTVSTLAMDTAPNYQQELAKCQYYFVNVFLHKKNFAGPYFAEGNANQLYFGVDLPTPMRANPSIELDSENIYVLGNNAHTTITTYTAGVTCIDNNVLKAFLTDLDATEITNVNDHLYALNFFDSNTKKFWLSADL